MGIFIEIGTVKYKTYTLQIVARCVGYLDAVVISVYTEICKSILQNLWVKSVDASEANIHQFQNLKGKLHNSNFRQNIANNFM